MELSSTKYFQPSSRNYYDDSDATSYDTQSIINTNPPPTPNDLSSNSCIASDSQDDDIDGSDDGTVVLETDTVTECGSEYLYPCYPPPNTSDSAYSDGSVINDLTGLYAPPPSSVSSMSITRSHFPEDRRNEISYSGHKVYKRDFRTYNTYI